MRRTDCANMHSHDGSTGANTEAQLSSSTLVCTRGIYLVTRLELMVNTT
jgi:hypothetical protein